MRVLVVWTGEALDLDDLTAAESAHLAALPGPARRTDWLTSRCAQRLLLGLLGLPKDTTAYAYPHRRLSLSHTAQGSVAAGVVGPPPAALAGLGVDLEPDRRVDPRTARFFLGERERAWLAGVSAESRASEHVRLWTVKEALFKADPADTNLLDYTTDDPAGRSGRARRATAGDLAFAYSSGRLRTDHLSVAAAFRPVPPPRSPMSASTVSFDQVAEQVGETLSIPAQSLTPETNLRDLAADSFMLVEMVVDLQEKFDAMFTQSELKEISTLGELTGLLSTAR